ncbi:fluoride efflux transporter FluC [Oceanobacillus sp. FSL H7-0719]|uniref:fluoride efflux transporter FluC n=1 Tax=Oceanobacillus sp. FSL H7-0719 TaxID=2954507 RepID=UPI00324AE5D6
MTLFHIMLVGAGGFFGAISRYMISKKLNDSAASLPIGTLIVNLAGSFLLGFITGMQAELIILLLFGTGFIGALTTFSTLKLEMSVFYRDGRTKKLIIYTIFTYGIGIVLAYFGFLVGDYLK